MLQAQALDILKMGHNVFLTGAAGSGKTHTLRAYIDHLRKHNIGVAITASTGIAATHLGGVTIHSWSGLGIRDSLSEYDIENLQEKSYLWKRFEQTKVLIIDEVSMLHHFRFDMLDRLARAFKANDLPFGGMQIVLCGDFFQLPPVARYGEPPAYFAYQSRVWKDMNLKICYLSEQHRQHDDNFLSVLNDIRSNQVDDATLEHLRQRYKKDTNLQVEPTRLSSHNEDVDAINNKELDGIGGIEKVYLMDSKGKANLVETLVKSCLAPEELRLKEGARVMFVKNNFDKGYVNGTLGLVEGFDEEGLPIVLTAQGAKITAERDTWSIEEDGKVKAQISQLPLRLAWAITIHKSQGMSLDAAEIDLSKSFVAGMGYVALSRVKSLAGLKLMGFNANALQVHPEVLQMDAQLRRQSDQAVQQLTEMQEMRGKDAVKKIQEKFIEDNASEKKTYKTVKRKVAVSDGDIQLEEEIEEIVDMSRLPAYMQTKYMLIEGASLDAIAKERAVKPETIIDHIENLIKEKVLAQEGIDISYLKKAAFGDSKSKIKYEKIKKVFEKLLEAEDNEDGVSAEAWRLAPVKNKLGNSFSYADIRLARIFIMDELDR